MLLNTETAPPDQAVLKDFLLTAIRSATLRAKLDVNELQSIGAALTHDWITPEGAIEWLSDLGLAPQVIPDGAQS
jgi:hypothetical protein